MLNEEHTIILAEYDRLTHPYGEHCYGYLAMSENSTEAVVNSFTLSKVVPELVRQGYLEFHKGLMTEDGMCAGSGHCISVKGKNIYNGSVTFQRGNP